MSAGNKKRRTTELTTDAKKKPVVVYDGTGGHPIASEAALSTATAQSTDFSKYSVKNYKCDDGKYVQGDGKHDDTTGIQRAINSLPLNTNSEKSPVRFSNGGLLFFPRGLYKVTSTIKLRRGVHITGESRESSQILSFTAGSVLKYSDVGSDVQDEIVIENLSIWQDDSVVSTTGAGIEFTFGPTGVQSLAVKCDNLIIGLTYRGVALSAGVWSSFRNINVILAVTNGFEIIRTVGETNLSTTSVVFEACYASECKSGFMLDSSYYTSLISCASDSNKEYGYAIKNSSGVSVISSGAEENGLAGAYVENSYGTILNMFVLYDVKNGLQDGIVLNGSFNTTLLGGSLVSSSAKGYGVKVAAVGGNITCIGTSFRYNYASNSCNDQKMFLNLSGSNGFVGDKGNYAIGSPLNAPDPSTHLQVGGICNGTTDKGLSVRPYFTFAGLLRNVAGFFQALIDTASTLTYSLVCGIYIANADKGGGSSIISRLAGLYINQQTAGTSANANIMIDVSQGTVPGGHWNIYSDSTRESVFKGGFRMGGSSGCLWTFGTGSPEGVVSAPIGSMYTRSDGGAGSTLYIKESGADKTGWIAK